jgi:hypothetical protein
VLTIVEGSERAIQSLESLAGRSFLGVVLVEFCCRIAEAGSVILF